MTMRKVDVYTNNVLINDEPVRGVLDIHTPGPNKPASITLVVDGPITYHNTPMPARPIQPEAMPYDFYGEYKKLVERLTVAAQKKQIAQEAYENLLRGLYEI